MNSKKDKVKEANTDTHYHQTVKTQSQKENIESSKGETRLIQGIFNKIIRFLIRNLEARKYGVDTAEVLKEKNLKREFSIW